MTSTYRAIDQHPFGMQIQSRSYTAPDKDYRFGFNGYEAEDNINGTGNCLDFGARIYDTRLAKFLSLDPIFYPEWSPYQYDGNSPISIKDIFGMGPGGWKKEASEGGGAIFVPEDAITINTVNVGPYAANAPRTLNQFALSSGEVYVASFNASGSFIGYKNTTDGSLYVAPEIKQLNVVIVGGTASMDDEKQGPEHIIYAMHWDKDRFIEMSQRDKRDGKQNFFVIEADNVQQMADNIKELCESEAGMVANLIIDFHGSNRRFNIGLNTLNDNNVTNYRSALEKAGYYMSSKTNVLMGNCNIGVHHVGVLQVMSKSFNDATIYGHQSYCMSVNVGRGSFASRLGTKERYDYADLSLVDKWTKVSGNSVTDVTGVRFKTVQTRTLKVNKRGHLYWHSSPNVGTIYEK